MMRQAILITTATNRKAASTALAKIIPGVVTTFDVPLEANGKTTSYWCCIGGLTQTQYEALEAIGLWSLHDRDTTQPEDVLTAKRLSIHDTH